MREPLIAPGGLLKAGLPMTNAASRRSPRPLVGPCRTALGTWALEQLDELARRAFAACELPPITRRTDSPTAHSPSILPPRALCLAALAAAVTLVAVPLRPAPADPAP